MSSLLLIRLTTGAEREFGITPEEEGGLRRALELNPLPSGFFFHAEDGDCFFFRESIVEFVFVKEKPR